MCFFFSFSFSNIEKNKKKKRIVIMGAKSEHVGDVRTKIGVIVVYTARAFMPKNSFLSGANFSIFTRGDDNGDAATFRIRRYEKRNENGSERKGPKGNLLSFM